MNLTIKQNYFKIFKKKTTENLWNLGLGKYFFSA